MLTYGRLDNLRDMIRSNKILNNKFTQNKSAMEIINLSQPTVYVVL